MGDISQLFRQPGRDPPPVLAAHPGDPRALTLAATIAARAGNRDLAAGLLARAGDGIRDIPAALLLSGGLHYAAGRTEQAVVTWRAFSTASR
ncbi:hypothetical protein AB5I41_28230 [Sphingomonas sp. MMS24-JH45]